MTATMYIEKKVIIPKITVCFPISCIQLVFPTISSIVNKLPTTPFLLLFTIQSFKINILGFLFSVLEIEQGNSHNVFRNHSSKLILIISEIPRIAYLCE